MRYSQVKAVTFEKIIEDDGLTADFNVLVVLLSYGAAGHFSSKPKKCPAGLIATIPLALSYVYTRPIIWSRFGDPYEQAQYMYSLIESEV